MIRPVLSGAVLTVVLCGSAHSQEPSPPPSYAPTLSEQAVAARLARKVQSPLASEFEAPQLQPQPQTTPEMWLYLQQMQRFDNPRMAVRRKAMFHAKQRAARIESRKWFGYSNLRPRASTTPLMDNYSPAWRGNSLHPFDWTGIGYPGVTLHVDGVRQRY